MQNLIRKFKGTGECGFPVFVIRWTAFQVVNQDKFRSSALAKRFSTKLSGQKPTAPPKEPHITYERAYELAAASDPLPNYERAYELTAASNSLPNTEMGSAGQRFADFFARRLQADGLMDNACLGGALGILGENKFRGDPKWYFSCNPNYRHGRKSSQWVKAAYERLTLYLTLLNKYDPSYSNSDVLLRNIMPMSNVPCVFSYHFVNGLEKIIRLVMESHSDFLEIRFEIDATRIQKVLPNWELKEIQSEDFALPLTPQIIPSIDATLAEILNNVTIDGLKKELLADLEFSKVGLPKGFKLHFRKCLEKNGAGIIASGLLLATTTMSAGVKSAVIYPATYFLASQPTADNSVIMLYDILMGAGDYRFRFDHEFKKLNILYHGYGMHAVERKVEGATKYTDRRTFAHSLLGLTNCVFGDVNGFSRLKPMPRAAINMIRSLALTWSDKPPTAQRHFEKIDLEELGELAISVAFSRFEARINYNDGRVFDKSISDHEAERLLKRIQDFRGHVYKSKCRIGKLKEALRFEISQPEVNTRWVDWIGSTIYVALTQAVYHGIVTYCYFQAFHSAGSDGRALVGFEITNREDILSIQISNCAISNFDPVITQDYLAIANAVNKTKGAIEFRWEVKQIDNLNYSRIIFKIREGHAP